MRATLGGEFKGCGSIFPEGDMGIELLACLVLKAFDKAGPSTGKELLDVCFCELYPADLSEDVEATRLVAALDDLSKDATESSAQSGQR